MDLSLYSPEEATAWREKYRDWKEKFAKNPVLFLHSEIEIFLWKKPIPTDVTWVPKSNFAILSRFQAAIFGIYSRKNFLKWNRFVPFFSNFQNQKIFKNRFPQFDRHFQKKNIGNFVWKSPTLRKTSGKNFAKQMHSGYCTNLLIYWIGEPPLKSCK